MKKISYYVVLTVIFFTFSACKTGDINMPKPSKSSSSSAKLEQLEEFPENDTIHTIEENIEKQSESQTLTEEDKIKNTTTEDIPDETTLVINEPVNEDEKEVFESVSIAEPETTAKTVHIPEVEKNETPGKISSKPKTETISISDKKVETTQKTETKPTLKQETQQQKIDTTPQSTTTVNKSKSNATEKKTEPAAKNEKKQEEDSKISEPSVKINEEIKPVEKKENTKDLNIIPSRTIEIGLNQYLDVFYPGAGWVYLGEQDESVSLLSFFDRNLDENDTKFILRAKKPGVAILHFYKQDLLTDTYIDDYLKVIVNKEKYKGKEHSVAPSYAEIVPPNQQKYIAMAESAQNDMNFIPPADNEIVESLPSITQNEPVINLQDQPVVLQRDESDLKEGDKRATSTIIKDDTTQIASTQISGSDKASEKNDYTADELLALAKKARDEKRYNDSLNLLNSFFEKAVNSLDEGWFLKGQLYEENDTDFKNIRTSLESYQILVDRYPSSRLWKAANERINYINRFYFKIR